MKRILAMLLALSLLCSCQKGPDAVQTAEALCRLYISGDTAVMGLLNDSNAEQVHDEIKEGLYEQLSDNLEAIGVGELDQKQLNAVVEEMMAARSRIPLDVELSAEEKGKVSLTITVGSLDMSAIDTAAAEKALAAMNGAAEDSEQYRQQLLNHYLEALRDALNAFDGSGETSAIEVEFLKTEGLWRPADIQGFINALGQAIRR